MLIQALEQTSNSGSKPYPIYIGFLKAQELLSVAEVPNFKNTTTNHDIATNALTPPVKQWQRPLLEDRRDRIVSNSQSKVPDFSTSAFGSGDSFFPQPARHKHKANKAMNAGFISKISTHHRHSSKAQEGSELSDC